MWLLACCLCLALLGAAAPIGPAASPPSLAQALSGPNGALLTAGELAVDANLLILLSALENQPAGTPPPSAQHPPAPGTTPDPFAATVTGDGLILGGSELLRDAVLAGLGGNDLAAFIFENNIIGLGLSAAGYLSVLAATASTPPAPSSFVGTIAPTSAAQAASLVNNEVGNELGLTSGLLVVAGSAAGLPVLSPGESADAGNVGVIAAGSIVVAGNVLTQNAGIAQLLPVAPGASSANAAQYEYVNNVAGDALNAAALFVGLGAVIADAPEPVFIPIAADPPPASTSPSPAPPAPAPTAPPAQQQPTSNGHSNDAKRGRHTDLSGGA